MKITILGCGAAGGVPMISVGWGRCDPKNPKNRRRRSSILIENEETILLIDSGPDLREQLIDAGVNRLDAVLYTHAHADHTHGIDDLREINRTIMGPIDIYGEKQCLDDIDRHFSYVFDPIDLKTTSLYKPWLRRHEISGLFSVKGVEIRALEQDHGFSRSTGYRIGNFAYCTDVMEFSEESFGHLMGLDAWIVGCLRFPAHETHAHIAKVLDWVERLRPKKTYLTHMGPGLDYDEMINRALPENVVPAYDGLVLEIA
ncbi:metal-dependent hydrolase [Alphaproteobacteria bacterium]|nr:metal-dependent hydrolase [Alphaproteobacteria bacterium]